MANRNNNRRSSRNRPRRKPSNPKPTSKGLPEIKEGVNESHGNDVSWYKHDPKLFEIATKLNTNNPLGIEYRLVEKITTADTETWTPKAYRKFEPGVMRLNVAFGPGPAYGKTSAVNVAAAKMYSYIRHANSGAANYDSASLMMLILAIDSAYIWYATLVRLYGVMKLYSGVNRYYPRTLIRAMGFDPDDLAQNWNLLPWTINRFVNQIGSLYIPNMEIFQRHMFMCSNYFLDADSAKGQTYLFVPSGLHFIDYETVHDPESGTDKEVQYLKWLHWNYMATEESGPVALTYTQIQQICDKFADLLMYDSDVAMISGDIRKAYGDNVMHLDEIPSDFTLLPKLDWNILDQIHNATIMPGVRVSDASIYGIHQAFDTANASFYVSYDPFTGNTNLNSYSYDRKGVIFGKRMLDFRTDDPSSDDIMEATRLTTCAHAYPEGNWSFGTEFIDGAYIYTFEYNANNHVHLAEYPISYASVFTSYGAILDNLSNLMAFDYAPAALTCHTVSSGDTQQVASVHLWYNTKNYTVVDYDEIFKLHDTAILSEWDIPEVTPFRR